MEKVAEFVFANKGDEIFVTSLVMQYAYGQSILHPDTLKQCVFQIVGDESTGMFTFNAGYYGLTLMPLKYLKIMDNISH